MAIQRLWRDWAGLLSHLYTELRYTARPIQELLAALDSGQYPSLGWLADFTDQSEGAKLPRTLSAEEAVFAKGFFSFVGRSDLEGQLAHVTQYAERARELYEAASDRRQRLSRVYLSTAACAGLCIGVLIL